MNKEMFYLEKRNLVLRPEGTVNVMESLIQENSFKEEDFPL